MMRFAPSPTGEIKIDDLRIALFSYIVSRQRGEGFILRFDDSDNDMEGGDGDIERILEKFSIVPDRKSYRSEHLSMHRRLAMGLVRDGKAFVCRSIGEDTEDIQCGKCGDTGLEELRRVESEKIPYLVKLKKPQKEIIFTDRRRGEILFTPDDIGDFVILERDGTPTDDFASACDDMLDSIDFVVERDENMINTALQVHIRRSLGYENDIEYLHLPDTICRDGRQSETMHEICDVKWLLRRGFIPDAIINLLLMPGKRNDTDIFDMSEAVEWFDIGDIGERPYIFDIDELRYLNTEHLRRMDEVKLSRIFGFADADIGSLAKIHLSEAGTIEELDEKIEKIFKPKNPPPEWVEEMRILESAIYEAPPFGDFEEFVKHLSRTSGLEGERLSIPLSLLMRGCVDGPELSEIYRYTKSYILEVAKCRH